MDSKNYEERNLKFLREKYTDTGCYAVPAVLNSEARNQY